MCLSVYVDHMLTFDSYIKNFICTYKHFIDILGLPRVDLLQLNEDDGMKQI